MTNNLIGIRADIGINEYHGSGGISKSGLWTIYNKSPAHYRYGDDRPTKAKSFGEVAHTALLEPERLEKDYACLPESHNGVTKEGKQIVADIKESGRTPVKHADWVAALYVRQRLLADPIVKKVMKDAVFENSAYWNDKETGVLCRCRPDIYSPSLKMMVDLKTCRDASNYAFSRTVEEYGYHVQDAFYRDGWTKAGGGDVDAFIFIAVESASPQVYQIFELDQFDRDDGHAIARSALRTYADCLEKDEWRGYSSGVVSIGRPKWAYESMALEREVYNFQKGSENE